MKEYIIVIGDDPDIMGNYGLKEKPKELVRCKDCKHYNDGGIDKNRKPFNGYCRKPQHTSFGGDNWFCADGELKD